MTIGNLNGKWELLLKIVLSMASVTLPCVIWLNVWFVQQVYEMKRDSSLLSYQIEQFMKEGPRFTPQDAELEHMKLKQEILNEIRDILEEDAH